MLNKLNNLKNYICKFLLVVCLIAISLVAKTSFTTTKQLFALNSEDVSDDLLGNPNFYTTSSSSISSNSHWSVITPSDEKNSSEFKKGIVQLDKIEQTIENDEKETANKTDGTIVDDLWDDYGLFVSPGAVDSIHVEDEEKDGVDDYLMINAHNFAGHMGYESDDFTLAKGSFYKVAVTLKTINDSKVVEYKEKEDSELIEEERVSQANASIYINGIANTEEADTCFELINTNNKWQTYYFYINTNSFTENKNVTVQLYLGSKSNLCQGAVFFSHVKIEQYSEADYINELTEDVKAKTNVKSVSLDNAYAYDFVDNSGFESNLANWTTIGSNNNGDIFADVIDTNVRGNVHGNANYPTIPESNNSSLNNIKALLLYSNPDDETGTYYGVESNSFLVEQYGMYRISLWAYSNSGSSTGAYITLYDVDNDKVLKSQQISTSMNKSNSLSNNWTRYEFYIKGNSLRDSNLKLRLTLGTNDTKDKTENYAFFDDIRMQRVNYTDYSSGKKDTNSVELNATLSDTMLISNYTFDMVENSEIEPIKPMTATGWTISGTKDLVYGGVINTNTELFNNNKSNYSNITNLINPGKINPVSPIDSNNVLMLGTAKTDQTISAKTSSTFSLKASTYYKLSFDVFTQNLSTTSNGANLIITDSNGAAILALDNIKTNSEWNSYTYYIATNLLSSTCNLELNIKNTDMYAYFDNICLQSVDAAIYNNATNNKVDLSKAYLDDTNSWALNSTNNSYFGVINPEDFEISVDDQKIAYLISDNDVNQYASSKSTFNLDGSSYYKISAYINTVNIRKLDNPNNATEYGARFGISYNEKIEGFTNIQSSEDFKEYVMYISTTDSTTINILFGLGQEENKVAGEMYITNLSISKFADEAEFNSDKEASTAEISTIDIEAAEEENPDEEITEEEEPYNVAPNWIAISGFITSAAMILLIFAILIKKIDFKKKKKKVDTSYDRRQTLDKRYDLKERIAYREEMLESLMEELNDIKKTTKEFKDESEPKINELKVAADEASASLRQELDDLYKERLAISSEHNKLIAKDKLNASKEEDERFNAKMSELDSKEKNLKLKVKAINKHYNKEKATYDVLMTKSKTKQDELNHQISILKDEVDELNAEMKALAEGKPIK